MNLKKTYKTTTESRIAFTSNRDGNFGIYIMNVDGSEQRRLTYNPADDIFLAFHLKVLSVLLTCDL